MKKTGIRGQQVKTFQAHIPQPDLTHQKVVEKVYFQASDGFFSIYPQPHILGLVRSDSFDKHYRGGHTWWRADRITATDLASLLEIHRDVLERYASLVKEATKEKVIVFNLKCNVRSLHHLPRDDMHFAPAPALALQYAVRWRSGGHLYRFDEQDPELGMQRSHAEGTVIDWTAEREAFFEAMQNGLINAIDRLLDFEKALKGDPTRAIQQMTGQALLPAPASSPQGS